jgi:peptidoglycan/xylan/chitin deacetylase (PgdA/CDA1 family)
VCQDGEVVALSKKVALTVDLEEWTVPEDFTLTQVPESVKLEVACRGLNRLMDIFSVEGVKATFFVTTYFAKRNSELLRNILQAGHEIGNHGLEHVRKPRRTLKEEVEAIKESTSVIEKSAGIKPCGYREPYLAISKSTIAALTQVGYLYDSSILGTWLPNKIQWITVPSIPFKWETRIFDEQQNLVEFPLSVIPKLRAPVGWWWFRKNFGESIPLATASLLFRLAQPFIINMHTWELTEIPPGYSVPFHVRFNCGERSVIQIHRLITGLKRLGAEFVLMKTMVLDNPTLRGSARN